VATSLLHRPLLPCFSAFTCPQVSDVVLETKVLVSRRLEEKKYSLGLGLGLGLETQSLGLGLGL